jgi:hypothetical protein
MKNNPQGPYFEIVEEIQKVMMTVLKTFRRRLLKCCGS